MQNQNKFNFFTIEDLSHAIGIIEEFVDIPSDVDEYDANVLAFQYLIDTGHVWHLQGWYGRCAVNLINEGICKPKKTIDPQTDTTKRKDQSKPKKTI